MHCLAEVTTNLCAYKSPCTIMFNTNYSLVKNMRLPHMKRVVACACLCTRLKQQQQIPRLKQQRFLSFTFYITQRSSEKIMCIYLLLHWFSGENCIIFTFSLQKGQLKRNMNDGTIISLTSLLIPSTWNILLLFSFRQKIISCFKTLFFSFNLSY